MTCKHKGPEEEMPCYGADDQSVEMPCSGCMYSTTWWGGNLYEKEEAFFLSDEDPVSPHDDDHCHECGEYPCKCDGDWAPAMDFYRPF